MRANALLSPLLALVLVFETAAQADLQHGHAIRTHKRARPLSLTPELNVIERSTPLRDTNFRSPTPVRRSAAPDGDTKYVFMHVIVGNWCVYPLSSSFAALNAPSYDHTPADWTADIQAMQAQSIDAIALNIGGDDWQKTQMDYAYAAAEALDSTVKLFISFDFTTDLGCTLSDIIALTQDYSSHPWQFTVNGKPMISSYEGSCLGNDGWQTLKDETNAYLMPFMSDLEGDFSSWTSLDSWYCWGCAWPQGDFDKNTADDEYYMGELGSNILYSTTISGWFYTHLSDKNRLLRSDDWLLNSRWNQLVQMRDDIQFVEMVTWNDFGESDYFGTITIDQPAGTDFVNGFPHIAWMPMNGYYIQAFKTGVYPTITEDVIYYWARPHPWDQAATLPGDSLPRPDNYNWTQDYLWAAAFCSSTCTVGLQVGDSSNTWYDLPSGVNLLQLPLATGGITVNMVKSSTTVIDQSPTDYTYIAVPSIYNYNAYVGAATATTGTTTGTTTATTSTTTSTTTGTTTTTATTTSATAATTTVNSVSWTHLGCYVDSGNPRTLSGVEYDSSSATSILSCLSQCGNAGYVYAGLEYGSQCFCASSIASEAAAASQSNCNYACSSGTGTCGGFYYIDIYSTPTTTATTTASASTASTTTVGSVPWSALGCYTDSGSARALSYTGPSSASNSISSCLSTCSGLGYIYGGVEYGTECYCGSSLASSSVASSSGNCDYACPSGDGTCGGFYYINVYEAASGLTGTSTTTTTAASTTSTGYSYLGCFPDSGSSRTLSGIEVDSSSSNSVASCQSTCSNSGYAYSGVEYGEQCFCAASIASGVTAGSESNCNYACSSGVGTCGGFDYINVYQAPASTTTAASATTTTIGSISWQVLGCYSDSSDSRVLSYMASSTSTNTVSSCLSTCGADGYTYGGVEYGSQCFCGSSLASSATSASSSNCNYSCAGGTGTCGGFDYINVYHQV
ncbi:glycosyl hydrolase family 71-domain-containing protein [Mycena maculata]|uniref:Glycosyl hydrolase family 71-domain-containing protein n=1 Tax=Mycena maculata TaxID=230809 RepID=A0AAD7K3Q0_9AGAR|nr:glycosyl hydrolase family 71-domain-containing protein [Mycena maculata]